MRLKLSKYLVVSDKFVKKGTSEEVRIMFSTRRGMGIQVTEAGYQVIITSAFEHLSDRLFTVLMYHEIIVPENENELEEIVANKVLRTLDKKETEFCYTINSADQISQLKAKLQCKQGSNTLVELSTNSITSSMELKIQICSEILSESRKDLKFSIGVRNLIASDFREGMPLVTNDLTLLNVIYDEHFSLPFSKQLKDLQEAFRIRSDVRLHINIGIHAALLNEDSIPILKQMTNLNYIKLFLVPGSTQSERQLLKKMADNELRISVLPDATVSTYWTSAKGEKSHLFFAPTDSKRKDYDRQMAKELQNGTLKCEDCIYLPMCGGHKKMTLNSDLKCPDFTKWFSERIFAKYSLTFS